MSEDNQREYKVGQRVYCPTYGGYGQITKMGTDKATITMIGMWGIGSVQIKHGDYEQPKYQPDHGYNEPLHESYQKYSEGVWNTGEMALTYHDWLQERVAQIAQLTAERDALRKALEPFASTYGAFERAANAYHAMTGDDMDFKTWWEASNDCFAIRAACEAAYEALQSTLEKE